MVIESVSRKTELKTRKSERVQPPPSKVVIRKLPPTFTEKDFKDVVSPIPDCNYFYFAQADKSLGQFAYSRAYLNFTNTEEIILFKERFDGYVFVDQQGNEYPALVEYAPFQKIPKVTHQKKDARCGTIDEDPDYVNFLETLKNPETVSLPQIETLLEEIETQEKELKANHGVPKVKTPLLEYIEQRSYDRLRPGDKRRRKEFDRKKLREEEKRKRKDIKDTRRSDERNQGSSASSATSYRERQKRREEEKQRILEIKDREKKQRKAKEYEKYSGYGKSDGFTEKKSDPKSYNDDSTKSESFKSKRYSEARKKDEKKHKENSKETNEIRRASSDTPIAEIDSREFDEGQAKAPDEDKKDNTRKEEEETKGDDDIKPIEEVEKDLVEQEELNKEKEEESNKSEEREDSVEKEDSNHYREYSSDGQSNKKDPRTERRIRNKDRPDMQLYRPGRSNLRNRVGKNAEDETVDKIGNEDSSSSCCSPVQSVTDESNDKQGAIKNSGSTREKDSCKTPHEKKWSKGRESRGGYYWEADDFDDRSNKGRRGGYSYNQERENKGKWKSKEQESASRLKSMTFHRSTSQE